MQGQKDYDKAQATKQTPSTKVTVPVQAEVVPDPPSGGSSKPAASRTDPHSIDEVMATQRRQQVMANKENLGAKRKRFIDPQKSAKSIQFEQDEDDEDHQPRRKRQKSTVTDEDEEDVFETTEAPRRHATRSGTVPTAAPKRSTKATGRRQPRNMLTDHQDQGLPPDSPIQASPSRSSSSSPSHLPTAAQRLLASSADRSTAEVSIAPPSLTPIERIQQLKQLPRDNRVQRPTIVQKRKAYTEQEEARLVELVESNGISWSLIKNLDDEHPDGAVLGGRSQVQIKDKLQEMKFQLLK